MAEKPTTCPLPNLQCISSLSEGRSARSCTTT